MLWLVWLVRSWMQIKTSEDRNFLEFTKCFPLCFMGPSSVSSLLKMIFFSPTSDDWGSILHMRPPHINKRQSGCFKYSVVSNKHRDFSTLKETIYQIGLVLTCHKTKPIWYMVWFYGMSTIVGYLMPNPFLYIWTVLFQIIQFSISTLFISI